MSIYNINGELLSFAYNVNGTPLQSAYDIDGNIIFSKNIIIMSYNCGQWLTGGGTGTSTEDTSAVNHRALLESIMTAQNPDILCIQEYWDVIGTVQVKNLLTEYMPYYQEVNGETATFGHAIFSKYPITDFMTSALASPLDFKTVAESSNTGRFLDKCTVTVEGNEITVFNTHLATSSQEATKVAQAELICDYLENYSTFILCGDFNTVCKSTSDQEYTTIMKQFVDAGYCVANCSSQHGFIDSWTEGTSLSDTWYPCDHIIASSDFTMSNVHVDETKLTDGLNEVIDHLPIVATLSLA